MAQFGANLVDIYRDSVRETYDGTVFFINPREFTGDPGHDSKLIAEQFSEQFPDEQPIDLSDPAQRVATEQLAFEVKDVGAAAIPQGSTCIVIEPGHDWATVPGWIEAATGIPPAYQKQVDVSIEDVTAQTARHEAGHCVDNPDNILTWADRLKAETQADYNAYMRGHEQSGMEENPVTEFDQHLRAIGAGKAPHYATNMMINEAQRGNEPDAEEVLETASSYESTMHEIVADEIGLDGASESRDLYTDNPELFFDVVDNLVLQGAFDENQMVKDAVMDLSAAERAIKDFDKAGFGYEDHDLESEEKAVTYLGKEPTIVDENGDVQPKETQTAEASGPALPVPG